MKMGARWNDTDKGKTKVQEIKPVCNTATLFTTNPIRKELESNSGLHGAPAVAQPTVSTTPEVSRIHVVFWSASSSV